MWDKYPELRPDYEEWKAKNEIMSEVDGRIAEDKRIAAEKAAAEEAKKAEEEALKKAEEESIINEKINNISVVVDTVPINIHE